MTTTDPVTTTDAVTTADNQDGDSGEPLLRVDGMECAYRTPSGPVRAVDNVSFDVSAGETLGLVGESGCGKTSTGRSILQLPPPSAGSVRFEGRELVRASRRQLRPIRQRLQMIFQDPLSAFNPRRKVRDIVGEGLTIAGMRGADVDRRVGEVLEQVGMSLDTVGDRKPHEFSGGQCQRLAIARALALRPRLIICDEPVASLDVSVQAQVLNLLHDVKEHNDLALVFIAHDLAVVRNISDRVAVMYLGEIVEIGNAVDLYESPAHPYTQELLDAVPVPDTTVRSEPDDQRPRAGDSGVDTTVGCRFRDRCPRASQLCAEVNPPLRRLSTGHQVACHHPLNVD